MGDLIRRPNALTPWNAVDRLIAESFLPNWFRDDDFSVDVAEENGEITLRAELPGVKKENISIDLHGGVLSIKAKKIEESESKNESYIRKETRHGSFQRSFSVGIVEPDDINATYNDGILKISLKKKDSFKKIQIQ